MDSDRFAAAARALVGASTRRRLARLAAAVGLAAAGRTGIATGVDPASAAKKKPRKCKPKCPECRRCTRGKCKPAAEGRPCGGNGANASCQGGVCVSELIPLPCGAFGPCRVFVTEATVVGSNIGGPDGGDAICQAAALAAGLSGTYMAWLSAGGESPATRFTNRDKAGPYGLVRNAAEDGNDPPPTVADSFADLTECDPDSNLCLQHPIDRTENGVAPNEFAAVWTGTQPDGTAGAQTCGGWAATEPGESGLIGRTTATNAEWTQRDFSVACNTFQSLYCFEQA